MATNSNCCQGPLNTTPTCTPVSITKIIKKYNPIWQQNDKTSVMFCCSVKSNGISLSLPRTYGFHLVFSVLYDTDEYGGYENQ